jgi:hypothetical protein
MCLKYTQPYGGTPMSPLTSTVSEFKDSKGVLVSRHNIDLRQSSGEATCTQTGSGTGRAPIYTIFKDPSISTVVGQRYFTKCILIHSRPYTITGLNVPESHCFLSITQPAEPFQPSAANFRRSHQVLAATRPCNDEAHLFWPCRSRLMTS